MICFISTSLTYNLLLSFIALTHSARLHCCVHIYHVLLDNCSLQIESVLCSFLYHLSPVYRSVLYTQEVLNKCRLNELQASYIKWPKLCRGSKRQKFLLLCSQSNSKFMEDCLVLQNYAGLDFEIHRFSKNPIFISVNMPSREEWRKLLFIFLFTWVEFSQSLYSGRWEGTRRRRV